MADQELALFYDTPALFSVTEFQAPMPDTDALWLAKSATEWSGIFEKVHEFSGGYSSVGCGARPLSLKDLFRLFLDDEMFSQSMQMTPLHMRLLLHPLQSLVCQYRQHVSCVSSDTTTGFRTRPKSATTTPTAASTRLRLRLEEVKSLLQRWYDLADRYIKSTPHPLCPLMQASLIMFHLVSLNAVTNMPEIERLARREGLDDAVGARGAGDGGAGSAGAGYAYPQLVWMHKQCISDVEEAVFHAGQVLRLVRQMPGSVRPPWWAGAIYRAALVLWCDSLVHNDPVPSSSSPANGNLFATDDAASAFAVDALPPDHALVTRYLTKREGTPVLTKRDGSVLGLGDPFAVLFYCVDVVLEGISTRFSDGICNKLTSLAKN